MSAGKGNVHRQLQNKQKVPVPVSLTPQSRGVDRAFMRSGGPPRVTRAASLSEETMAQAPATTDGSPIVPQRVPLRKAENRSGWYPRSDARVATCVSSSLLPPEERLVIRREAARYLQGSGRRHATFLPRRHRAGAQEYLPGLSTLDQGSRWRSL